MKRPTFSGLRGARRGAALLFTAALLTLMSVVVLGYMSLAIRSARVTTQSETQERLDNAAESVIALAVNELWGDFREERAGEPSTPLHFQLFLDGRGLRNQASDVRPEPQDVTGLVDLLQRGRDMELDAVVVESLGIVRVDTPRSTRLEITAAVRGRVASDRPGLRGVLTSSVTDVWEVGRADWDGLEYALLANNINCVMCHTNVDNARRFYNLDPTLRGTFERVKVGSLESLQLRGEPDSSIAGTLYLTGQGLEHDGDLLADWGDLHFKSREFDVNGRLVEDPFGGLFETDLSPADPSNPQPGENLYLGYEPEGGNQVDGFLPDSFPSPFPDDGGLDVSTGLPVPGDAGNRVVDDSEFLSAAYGSDGVVSGGTITRLDGADRVTSEADLDALRRGNTEGLSGTVEGTVYLYGTEDDPILLDGDLAIHGDVVIHGHVKGTGSILASGNVYVPGDLLYADGSYGGAGRTFGTGADGVENALAIASGGNIMVGDFFHPRWGEGAPTDGTPATSFNFIMDELTIFNRMEWMKTQPTLPGERTRTLVGTREVTVTVYDEYRTEEYFVEVPIYEEVDDGTGYGTIRRIVGYREERRTRRIGIGEPRTETRTRNVYEWTQPQHTNPLYAGADYIPRYYGFTTGSPVAIYNGEGYFDPTTGTWRGPEHAGEWSASKLTYADPADPSDPLLYAPDGSPIAVVSTLTGGGGWISDELLRRIMEEGLASRSSSGPLEIDATLYSNNSIFGIIPARNKRGVDGRMIVNGAIVAADIGLLAPRGLQMNYDARGRGLLNLTSDREVTIRRQLWSPARAD